MQDWKKLEPNWFVVTFCISKKLNSHLYKFTKWKVMRTQDVHYRSNRFVRWNTKLYIKNLTCLKATYAKYITHPTENEEWHMIPYRHDLRLWFGGTTISIFGISNFRINRSIRMIRSMIPWLITDERRYITQTFILIGFLLGAI